MMNLGIVSIIASVFAVGLSLHIAIRSSAVKNEHRFTVLETIVGEIRKHFN